MGKVLGVFQSFKDAKFCSGKVQSFGVVEFQRCRVVELQSFLVSKFLEMQSFKDAELQSFIVAKFLGCRGYGVGECDTFFNKRIRR